MFIRRRTLDRRRRYTREFLETLVGQLEDAGFDQISVILPHNYESVDPRHPEVSIQDFIDKERNFAAVVFKAHSTDRNETLKVLFVNSNAKAIFVDDTFPAAESEPSGVYFESPDPARAYAVFEYFYEYLRQPTRRGFVRLTLLALASSFFLVFQVMAYLSKGQGVLQLQLGLGALFDLLAIALAAYVIFMFSALPTGLWVKPSRELKIVYLINMALKGQLRDNPVVQLVVTVIGGLIVAGFAKVLGWL